MGDSRCTVSLGWDGRPNGASLRRRGSAPLFKASVSRYFLSRGGGEGPNAAAPSSLWAGVAPPSSGAANGVTEDVAGMTGVFEDRGVPNLFFLALCGVPTSRWRYAVAHSS
jgi:hypothetical protein